MQPQDFLKEGDIDGALNALADAVRNDPSKAELRTFLFQLLAVKGQWERALNQLNVAGELQASALPMVQTYQAAINCEALREAVFAGNRSPLVFGDPERWIAMVLEALKLAANGDFEHATAMRDEAFESAPLVSGSVNGEAFEWLADADSRLGPFLEAIIEGKYYWIPMHRIAQVVIEEPVDLRDLVWIPAQFSWSNGGQSIGLIPVRYAGTTEAADPKLLLARLTEWNEHPGGNFFGVGQRLLATDAKEYSLLEVREVLFDAQD